MQRPDRNRLIDHVQEVVVLLDDDIRAVDVNDTIGSMLGIDPAEYLGADPFEYIHPDDRDRLLDQFSSAVETGDSVELATEHRHETGTGEYIWLASRVSSLPPSADAAYVVSSRDISDRMAAEARGKAVATRLHELSSTAPDVFWSFTADWSEVLFVNSAFEDIYGQSVETLEADPLAFLDTVHPTDLPAVEQAMEILASGTAVDIEYRVNSATDYSTWVWVQAEPIYEDGDVVRISGFSRDITDRRRREHQLSVMDNLLRHNLRNDMNVVLGQAGLAQDAEPAVEEHISSIRSTVESLLETADKQREVINVLQRRQGQQAHDLVNIAETVGSSLSQQYPNADVSIATDGTVDVLANQELEMAVSELVENAIAHSDAASPAVHVTVDACGDEAVLRVVDEATPIPAFEADVLTGDYDMDTVFHSGGLGLWLVYWIVDLSDGSIEVESIEAAGNAVCVRLPLCEQ